MHLTLFQIVKLLHFRKVINISNNLKNFFVTNFCKTYFFNTKCDDVHLKTNKKIIFNIQFTLLQNL